MLEPIKFRNMLICLFESKCKSWTNTTIEVWYNELKGYGEKELTIAFKKMIKSQDDFISVGKVLAMIGENIENIISVRAEKEWQECLLSAKHGGNDKISARAGKVLNSLGGMMWLRDSNPENHEWNRKEFMRIYEITPEPVDLDFRCYGQEAPMYLVKPDQKLLEE